MSEPLVVTFPKNLDHKSLDRFLVIHDAVGQRVQASFDHLVGEGCVRLDAHPEVVIGETDPLRYLTRLAREPLV